MLTTDVILLLTVLTMYALGLARLSRLDPCERYRLSIHYTALFACVFALLAGIHLRVFEESSFGGLRYIFTMICAGGLVGVVFVAFAELAPHFRLPAAFFARTLSQSRVETPAVSKAEIALSASYYMSVAIIACTAGTLAAVQRWLLEH